MDKKKSKERFVELEFDSPDHLRDILTKLFLLEVESVVERFAHGYQYFDILLSFRAKPRYDLATENSDKQSFSFPNIPIKGDRKLN